MTADHHIRMDDDIPPADTLYVSPPEAESLRQWLKSIEERVAKLEENAPFTPPAPYEASRT